MISDVATLEQTRKHLARTMTPLQRGFVYEKVFGASRELRHFSPHVLVRCELRMVPDSYELSQFMVYIDFHLPLGAGVDDAEFFQKAVAAAVRKARWAERCVAGLQWPRDVILEAQR